MTRACHGPIRAAVGDAFSDEEIDDLVARMAEAHRRRRGEEPLESDVEAWSTAAAELSNTLLKEALIERRLRIAAERAKARRRKQMARMGGTRASKLSAFMVGDQAQGFGRGLSVDAISRALQVDLWGDVERGLRQAGVFDRVVNWLGTSDRDFEERVVVEMARLNGGREQPTGDADAVKAAEVFNAAIDRGRRMQNGEGAWIGKLEGYVVRQQHDPLKVAGGFWREVGTLSLDRLKAGGWDAVKRAAMRKAFDRWRGTIEPLLHPRTFDGLETVRGLQGDLPFDGGPTDLKGKFLAKVWWDIVTGRHSVLKGMDDLGEFIAPPSKARSVSSSRVLHFADARAWLTYHRAYGRGTVYSAVSGDLSRAARNTALMRGFGPAPEAAFKAERERLLDAARGANDAMDGRALQARRLDWHFDELTGAGEVAESMRGAVVGRLIRADQSLSKLGGMMLSAFSDMPVAVQTLARAGVDFLEGYKGVLDGVARLDGPAAREVADLLDVGARSAASDLSQRFTASDGPAGWTAWAQRLFYKVNGFEFWNNGMRRGVTQMISAHLGSEAGSAWGGLKIGTRETLERFGFDAKSWDLVRAGAIEVEGRRWLTFDAVDQVTDAQAWAWAGLKGKQRTPQAAERARADLQVRLRALVGSVVDTAVSESGAVERVKVTRGTKPGTILGEAVRFFTQFWSFPLTFVGRQLGPAMAGYAGKKPAFLLAHLILATTGFGYVSMEAKQLAKGRAPRGLFTEEGVPDGSVFLAAMLQGGGLGIYGDFLFGEYNRFGGSPLGTLGGPAVGEFERLLKLFGRLREGEDAGAEAVRLLVGNTPFINVWWSRLALDMGLLWRINEAVSPGWASRYERRVEEETGSSFLVRPSEAVQ